MRKLQRMVGKYWLFFCSFSFSILISSVFVSLVVFCFVFFLIYIIILPVSCKSTDQIPFSKGTTKCSTEKVATIMSTIFPGSFLTKPINLWLSKWLKNSFFFLGNYWCRIFRGKVLDYQSGLLLVFTSLFSFIVISSVVHTQQTSYNYRCHFPYFLRITAPNILTIQAQLSVISSLNFSIIILFSSLCILFSSTLENIFLV